MAVQVRGAELWLGTVPIVAPVAVEVDVSESHLLEGSSFSLHRQVAVDVSEVVAFSTPAVVLAVASVGAEAGEVVGAFLADKVGEFGAVEQAVEEKEETAATRSLSATTTTAAAAIRKTSAQAHGLRLLRLLEKPVSVTEHTLVSVQRLGAVAAAVTNAAGRASYLPVLAVDVSKMYGKMEKVRFVDGDGEEREETLLSAVPDNVVISFDRSSGGGEGDGSVFGEFEFGLV